MKVLVVGAAGKTGRAVVAKAVEAGHEVTAFVRTADGYDVPGVRVHAGDARDADVVGAAVAGQDAVIDTVGGKTPYKRTTLETGVAKTIIAAMRLHGVRRLVVTSSVGVGDSIANTPFLVRIVVATFLRASTPDKATMEAAVRESGLDWVITRPAVLTDKPATGRIEVIPSGGPGKARAIPRADLAEFLVARLTGGEHLGTAVTLGGR
ncbi:NAD(P)-dependent oxidoreductase [Umezawaea tangerina]|uniref:Putative NADH-flavin reductase n=1 Tax=Umezawaea tangerina TaxID=84725 RepID=A0A2T0T6M8_9PSEU|nr:NAD(P)-binding oxidoreductase [Umezawaea tangerina]PRY41326.1 putative NADH-flavin reductase [Umezawaea tangerina]